MQTSQPLPKSDQRAFVFGIPIAMISIAAFFSGHAGWLSARAAATVAVAAGVVLIGLCLTQWARGSIRDRARIPVVAPFLLGGGPAAAGLGVLTNHAIGFVASVAVGVLAAAAFGLSIRRR